MSSNKVWVISAPSAKMYSIPTLHPLKMAQTPIILTGHCGPSLDILIIISFMIQYYLIFSHSYHFILILFMILKCPIIFVPSYEIQMNTNDL